MGVSLEGSNIDWEHLVPPHVITLSSDSIVYAWDVMEVFQMFTSYCIIYFIG